MAKTVKLSAKQIGKNIHIVIEGKSLKKKIEDEKEAKSISNKIELYNKKPSKELLEKIKDFFAPAAKVEKAKKEVVKKGVKSQVKKETKKVAAKKSSKKTKKEDPIEEVTGDELIAKVREEHSKGEVTDEQIESLQDLLDKAKAKKAEQAPKDEEKKEEQRAAPTYKRTGEY